MNRFVPCLVVAACAHAAPVPTSQPIDDSKRTPEMAQMDFFFGTWSCDTHHYPVGPRPELRYKSTIAVTHDLGGNWNAIRNSSQEATVAGYTGYHVAAKRFERFAVTDRGDVEHKVSDGWHGDDWVWTGTTSVMGRELPLRHTITKHGDAEFLSKYETQFGEQWVLVRDELCKKE